MKQVETQDKVLLKEEGIDRVGNQSPQHKVLEEMRIIISDRPNHSHKYKNLTNRSNHRVIESQVGKGIKSASLNNQVIADHGEATESKQLRTVVIYSSHPLYQMYQIAHAQTD